MNTLTKRVSNKAGATVLNSLRGKGVFVALTIITIFLAVSAPSFFTMNNLINVLRQASIIGIGAAGQALVIILAGIDLSVGSVLALSGTTAATLASTANYSGAIGLNWFLAIAVAIAIGGIAGLINATIITRVNIPPIITTLALSTILRGATYIWTNGIPVYQNLPKQFSTIGRGYLGPIPIPVILMLVVYVVIYYVLNYTSTGRYFYAIGGNEEAARLSGISVKKFQSLAYVICGITAAISGLIVLGRLNSAQPTAGTGFDMDVITAVCLGGVSLQGGKGKIENVFLGALIMAMLSNGLVLLNVSTYYQMVISGTVLLAAVGFDNLTN